MTQTTHKPAPRCPACGGAMVRETRRDTVTYKGRSVEIDQPGLWCTQCDEAIFASEDLAIRERALATIKAEIEGVLPPTEVKRIRTKIGLGVREAGRLLGGGEFAFQKYERGSAVVSHPMANLLRVLDARPKLVSLIVKGKRHRIEGGIAKEISMGRGGKIASTAKGVRLPRAADIAGDSKRDGGVRYGRKKRA